MGHQAVALRQASPALCVVDNDHGGPESASPVPHASASAARLSLGQ